MDEQRKYAYRQLLYGAMLDIRVYCEPHDDPSHDPLEWERRYHQGRIAGAIANWLHNLADQSSKDFVGFDEESFWGMHTYFCGRFPEGSIALYRQRFDECLKECGSENQSHRSKKKTGCWKPVLCGLLLVGGVLCGMGTWGFVHCEIFSRQEFREFTEESNRSSFGLTRYVGRLNGYDYFQVRLVFREKTLRVSAEESPVKEPYPLRLWPGNWRTGWFRNEAPGSEWFMWR